MNANNTLYMVGIALLLFIVFLAVDIWKGTNLWTWVERFTWMLAIAAALVASRVVVKHKPNL